MASGSPKHNENAIHLLERNLNKVNWILLSENPNAIDILEQNLDKVDWYWLSGNKNALKILEKNINNVDWDIFSENPSIFTFNYKEMMKKCKPFAEELTAYVFHPKRLIRFSKKYNIDFDILLEIY